MKTRSHPFQTRSLALLAGGVFALLSAAPGLAPGLALARADDAAVLREGEGPRRLALNAMERKPFDTSAWKELSEWQNGSALSATSTDGRVVLIVTWTDYLPAGKRTVALAKSLAEKHAKDGLIVVMVHSAQEWAGATKPKANADAQLLVAHDATGKFRETLKSDSDPDFYFIDRAGQLRFADVATDSVESATALLLAEKSSEAASLNERLANEAKRRDLESRRAESINQNADLTVFPVLSFPQPSAEAYEKADWPKLPKDQQKLKANPKATLAVKDVELPKEGWMPSMPELKGKVVVAYLWHPAEFRTYHQMMPQADLFQRQYRRDVVVVGLVSSVETKVGGDLTDDEKDPDKIKKRVEDILKTRKFEHFIANDIPNNMYTKITEKTEIPLPCMIIISTDNKARWFPHEDGQTTFDAALLQVLAVDPAVQARRKAEDAWLKEQGGKVPAAPAASQTKAPEPAPAPAPAAPEPGTGGPRGRPGGG
jgi:hypothetical protein